LANGPFFAPDIAKEKYMSLRYAAALLALATALSAHAGHVSLDTPANRAIWLNISDDFYNLRQHESDLRVFAFDCASHGQER
jgi:hypothetical protein